LAQWHVEQCGSGVVGMVTNHGYLENASFRGMRASLLKTFRRIQIVDLHGNAKMRERSPDGSRDENVFGIASGAAIGIFVRPGSPLGSPQIYRSELWGSRAEKLQRLGEESAPVASFTPYGPQYIFSPLARRACPSYDSAWRLCDAMPLNTTAPVTARDHFVVAFTREELIERVEAFRNLSIPNDIIRQRYFNRTRSSKYAPGDSRHWKLPVARRKLAEDDAWQQQIRVCQYRPLDYRYVLWHDALIDWPRREILRHLLEHENVALIARRQSPSGLPANFFWATQELALDGIIRSDNRGSESLFPLWRYDDSGTRQSNFSAEFIADFERKLGLPLIERYKALASVTSPHEFTPLALAGYLYGLFWSSDYRSRYQRELSADFPRIVPPHDAASFFETSRLGVQLLQGQTQIPRVQHREVLAGDCFVASGFPRWRDGQVWINPEAAIAEIGAEAWELRIGAHQVARKWLLDRRGRCLTTAEIANYRSLTEVLASTAGHIR
jgi:predicted helicase